MNPKVPQHIAIIMDGNRRWAKAHGLHMLAGHRKVTDEILEPLVEHASDLGIKYLTFWAWSTENWQRHKNEVQGIMKIFKNLIARRWQRLNEKGVRIKIIGDISKFDPEIREGLNMVVTGTQNNNKITAIFALNYGGRDEIIRSINKWNTNEKKGNKLSEEEFKKYLDTKDFPDPELIVRTGGEQRLSGFLLWQSEYSELYFADWFMPEFTPEKLDLVLADYAERRRRFGR